MSFEKTKRIFLQILIGCLIAAALLSVVTVLVGRFDEVFVKAIVTLVLIAVHSLVGLGFIVNNEKQKTAENFSLSTNATFAIIVLSFITSLLGLWGVLGGGLVGELYLLYLVLLFAVLHAEVLAKTLNKEAYLDRIVYANYIFMAGVILMLVPVIFVDNGGDILGDVYYRLLAALGIIDATLTLLAIILHRLYLQKHPSVQSVVFGAQQPGRIIGQASGGGQPPAPKQRHSGMSIVVAILVGYLVLQFLGGLVVAAIGALR